MASERRRLSNDWAKHRKAAVPARSQRDIDLIELANTKELAQKTPPGAKRDFLLRHCDRLTTRLQPRSATLAHRAATKP